jgi:tetratricopeptide (TPR) repeat protein
VNKRGRRASDIVTTMRIAKLALGFPLALALAVGPAFADDADATYKQGLALKSEGKTDDAIAAMESTVAKNPHHYMAWASLGNLYKTKKDIPKAVNAYEHAVEGLKKDKIVWSNLGMAQYRLYEQGGKKDAAILDRAIGSLTTASGIDPKDGEIRYQLGTLRRVKGDTAGAIADLEAATKLKPAEAQYWNNLGVAYRANKRDDDAVTAYKKAIELSPNDPGFHFNLAVALRRKTEKDPDQIPAAIAEYEKATGLDPSNADAWFDLGYMYKQDHQNDKAIEAFNKDLELNKGKDSAGAKKIQEELGTMGAAPADKKAPPPKKK